MEGTAVRAAAPSGLSRPATVAWLSVGIYAIFVIVSVFLELHFVGRVSLVDVWVVIALAASGVVGALIVSNHPRHPIGWMFCAVAFFLGASSFARDYAVQALVVAPGSLPFGPAIAWFGFWIDIPAVAVIALFLPLLFPDGRLPSPRWRPAAYVGGACVVLAALATMVAPDTMASAGYPSIRNPLGLDQYAGVFDMLQLLLKPLLPLIVAIGALGLLSRVRAADGEERQQIKWFAFAGALIVVAFAVGILADFVPALVSIADPVGGLALTALPVAVGIAILRNGLYDIDLIINKTVVYVLLTAVLAGLYTASVALLQRTFVAMTGQGSDIAIVMTLFVLATVFTPIKNTLQENVDRRIKPRATHAPRPIGIDDLLMLSELHDRGVLTDEEFAAKKKQVLGI